MSPKEVVGAYNLPMSAEAPKPGRPAKRLNIDMPWEEAVKKGLEKKRPAGGWGEEPDTPVEPEPDDERAPETAG